MGNGVSFRHPPVVETVLGVQFERLPAFTNAHLGAFWRSLGPEWPQVSDALRLDDQFERFGDAPVLWGRLALRISQDNAARLRIEKAARDRMIQVQNCRLDYNWLGQAGGEYPRYRIVRPEFDKALLAFREFVADAGLGELRPNQWEITYVNHLPKGTVWNEPADWPKAFRSPLQPTGCPEMARLESIVASWHYEILSQRGRIHVQVQHGRAGSPQGQEVLVLTLTARGPTDASVDEGLNLGHDAIVTTFRDITSPQAHDYWNREP